tara:strand:- start:1693 stop:2169 length:477 start_codon:yes stop_codon:yes gene_type:complete
MIDTLEIIRNIKRIYASDQIVETIVNLEKVLDDVNMYAYKNWALGEIVDGPHVTKYDTSATFMWEKQEMPDPEAGKRILNIGGKVRYKKDVKLTPRKIESYADYRPGTKKAKLDEIPVWLVEITIPNQVIEDFNAESQVTKTVSGASIDKAPKDASEL